MAVVTGTVQSAFGFTKPTGPSLQHTISSVKRELESCFVTVEFAAGTYASADDANFNPVSKIQAAKRDGKTPVILQAAFVSSGDENGSKRGAAACAVSGGATVTCGLTQEDLTTERADGAMSATWNRPMTFLVTYYQTI